MAKKAKKVSKKVAKKTVKPAKRTVRQTVAAPAPVVSRGMDEEKWKLVLALGLIAGAVVMYQMYLS